MRILERLNKEEVFLYRIKQVLQDGKTVNEIKHEFDISKSYIYQIKRKNNKQTAKL